MIGAGLEKHTRLNTHRPVWHVVASWLRAVGTGDAERTITYAQWQGAHNDAGKRTPTMTRQTQNNAHINNKLDHHHRDSKATDFSGESEPWVAILSHSASCVYQTSASHVFRQLRTRHSGIYNHHDVPWCYIKGPTAGSSSADRSLIKRYYVRDYLSWNIPWL